jgi:hypothetical protein
MNHLGLRRLAQLAQSAKPQVVNLLGFIYKNKKIGVIILGIVLLKNLYLNDQIGKIYTSSVAIIQTSENFQYGAAIEWLNNISGIHDANNNELASIQADLQTLRSSDFLQKFITEHNLFDELKQFRFKSGYDGDILLSLRPFDMLAAENSLRRRISYRQNPKSGIIFITLAWPVQDEVADLTNYLVDDLNRQLNLVEAEKAQLKYESLQSVFPQVTNANVRNSLADTLVEDLTTSINIQTSDDFLYKVIDTAVPPLRPVNAITLIASVSIIWLTIWQTLEIFVIWYLLVNARLIAEYLRLRFILPSVNY